MRLIIGFLLMISVPYSYAGKCNTDEKLVAFCDLAGEPKRSAAICANEKQGVSYYFKQGNTVELKVDFNSNRKLKRWVDLGTYTVYFGFNNGVYSYTLGVPEERPGALAFMDVKKEGITISSHECSSNSFGETNIKSNSIENVSDSSVRDNGFKFP